MKQADAVRRLLELCEYREQMPLTPIEEQSEAALEEQVEAHHLADRITGLSSPAQLRAMLDEAVILIRAMADECAQNGESHMDVIKEFIQERLYQYEDAGMDTPWEPDREDDYRI